jgi:hypothetical protein
MMHAWPRVVIVGLLFMTVLVEPHHAGDEARASSLGLSVQATKVGEVQAKLLCAKKITHAKSLLNFIRTETDPPILWQPADLNDELEELYSVCIFLLHPAHHVVVCSA